jgi:hypothetical protein
MENFSNMDNFYHGFDTAIQDLKGNWVPMEWSNSAIQAQVESADNYTEHYVRGYMAAITQFRSLPA